MKRIILITIVLYSFMYKAEGQEIKLNEVWINCATNSFNDTIIFEPDEIGFLFTIKNNTLNELSFGAYNPFWISDCAKFGCFEVDINSTVFKLNSNYDNQICIPSKDSIMISANWYSDILEPLISIDYDTIIRIEEDSLKEENKPMNGSNHQSNYCIRKDQKLYTSDFSEKTAFFSTMRDLIAVSDLSYICIEKDYSSEGCFDSIFPSQKVIKNNYFIIFTIGDDIINRQYIK